MSIISTLESIESTNLSMAIREGALYYPIIGGVHLLAIALFGGMLVATDLRLLGWAMQTRPISGHRRTVQELETIRVRGGGDQRFTARVGGAFETLSQPFVLGEDGAAGSGWRAFTDLSSQRVRECGAPGCFARYSWAREDGRYSVADFVGRLNFVRPFDRF